MLRLPVITREQINFTYNNEADVLNVALFGMTAREWKNKYNVRIREAATTEELIVLSNLENFNSFMIREQVSQSDRLKKLNEYALIQMRTLQTR